jgi:hypothetical protein
MQPPSTAYNPLAVVGRVGALLVMAHRESVRRQSRRWLGTVGVGLAMTAVVLTGVFPLLALCALACWWFLPGERLAPALAVGFGVVGVLWATVGIGLLAIEPTLLAGIQWVWLALMLALASTAASRYWPGRRT